MADPFDPGNGDPFAVGPVAKPGQTVPPTNIPQEMARARESAVQLGAQMTGAADVRQVLSGETPWSEAVAGAIPMMMGGPEVKAAEKVAGKAAKVFPELAERYPEVGPPITKFDPKKGKEYLGKQLTAEAKEVQKARGAAQKDIDAGNYTPYFKVSERSDVNPTRYPPYKSTTEQMPARPETIKKYMDHATNPEGVKRLQNAYEHGLTLPNSGNWYFMHQLEQEFIKEYGEQGPAMFKQRVADALAATTAGGAPADNLITASYANYIAARGEQFPAEAHQVPFPVGGGKYGILPNLKQYQKMLMKGGTGVTAENPKRYNFAANITGEAQAGTIDEQMMRLFDPTKAEPEYYGPYQQVVNDLAQANGVDPRYFQEVAWSGAKSFAAKGGKGGEYVPKPLIQEYNEAIERTSRITGVPPAEVVRRGIVRAEMPIYGTAGVIGAGVAAQQPQGDINAALGAGAEDAPLMLAYDDSATLTKTGGEPDRDTKRKLDILRAQRSVMDPKILNLPLPSENK